MADVEKFVLDGTDIYVKDSTARSAAATANANVATLTTRVVTIEEMSRLTVSYSSQNSTITFTTATH